MIKVSCPCGGTDIVGYDHILASGLFAGWERNALGEIEPIEAGESKIHWDTQQAWDAARPYQCNDCGDLLATKDLVVEEIEGDDDDD